MITYLFVFLFVTLSWAAMTTNTTIYMDPDTLVQYKIEFIYNDSNFQIINKIHHYPARILISYLHNKEFYDIDDFRGYFTRFKCWEDSIPDILRTIDYNKRPPYKYERNQ